MRSIIFITLSLLVTIANAQVNQKTTILTGKVTSANEEVMFAAVGIVNENVGTITNEAGEFELAIPDSYKDQLLTFSHIGYKPRSLKIDSLLKLDVVVVELEENIEQLREVVITARQLRGRAREYGNKKKHDLFISIRNGDRGAEVVTLIEPKAEIFLNSVSMNISNELQKEFTLLINAYSVNDSTGLPDSQLLKDQKIIRSDIEKGWLEVDMTKENLVIDGPFYIGFQWINVDESAPLVGTKIENEGKSLIRTKALGAWRRYGEWDIKVKATLYKGE